MEYVGAADYYFWLGVTAATGPGEDPPEFFMDNETTRACIEAWKWGLAFGLQLTEKEYLDLTTVQEPERIEVVKEKSTMQNIMVGNC